MNKNDGNDESFDQYMHGKQQELLVALVREYCTNRIANFCKAESLDWLFEILKRLMMLHHVGLAASFIGVTGEGHSPEDYRCLMQLACVTLLQRELVGEVIEQIDDSDNYLDPVCSCDWLATGLADCADPTSLPRSERVCFDIIDDLIDCGCLPRWLQAVTYEDAGFVSLKEYLRTAAERRWVQDDGEIAYEDEEDDDDDHKHKRMRAWQSLA